MGEHDQASGGRGGPGGPADPTRRAFLVTAGGAVAAGAAGSAIAGCAASAGSTRPTPGATEIRLRTSRAENLLPGETHWRIRHLGPPDAIAGFTGQASVLQGEPVTLYVSTIAREFRVSVLRMGWYSGLLARQVWQSGWIRGHRQRRPSVAGPARTVSCDWDPDLTMQTDDWPEGAYLLRLDASSGAQRYVPVTVRSFSTAGKMVLKNAVVTWQAHNAWGGYDLTAGPAGYQDRSLAVSMDRPYAGNGAQAFLAFERKLINLAERLGVPMAYTTSMDLDNGSHVLGGSSALISMGQDEYWSPAERAHVTAARNAGVNVAFFGAAAASRRIRLAPTPLGPDRLVICYPEPAPDSSLTGTAHESGPASADYVVVAPESWVFHGTGAQVGTRVRGLVGGQYDRVNPAGIVPRPIEILAHSPLTCRGVRSYADTAYYTHRRRAGVFSAGSARWVQSLAHPYGRELSSQDARFTRRVTANVLQAFAHGPAAYAFTANDNLAAMHEWPGDPVAAHHDLWPPVVR